MVVFYEESPTGWQNLNKRITNKENKCVKFDGTLYRDSSKEEENTICLFHNFNDLEEVQGLFWTRVHEWEVYEEEICSAIGNDTDIGLALYEVGSENQRLQEYFVDLAERKGYRLHLFYMGDWEAESVSYRSLLRTILNVNRYASVCF